MSEPQLFWYEQKELKDPIAVIGLPSIGLVGSITSSYLSRELKLPVVAGITYPDIQQYCLLQDGNAYPPIRVYAGPIPKAKKKKKAAPAEGEVKEETPKEELPRKRTKRRDIIVVTSEVAAKPEFTYDFTLDILNLMKEMGASEVIFVDGIPNNDPASMLMAAYSTERSKALLEESGITIMRDGIIRGVSGVALYQSKVDMLDTVCLISPASPQLPDPRAAAAVLDPLCKLIPRLEVDPSPLFKEADEIEKRLRAQQVQQSFTNENNLYG